VFSETLIRGICVGVGDGEGVLVGVMVCVVVGGGGVLVADSLGVVEAVAGGADP
jgi:hypothetical protein